MTWGWANDDSIFISGWSIVEIITEPQWENFFLITGMDYQREQTAGSDQICVFLYLLGAGERGVKMELNKPSEPS